ncbi:probable RTX [Vibrio ishigakensis]|uniref:Probable RTX n=1 Tax=Vibrio ishigakensis TaxID=1481914 RepID=A0A0B8PAM0_9VIBR|nr:probable RTX [Vibrio ishigakensis]
MDMKDGSFEHLAEGQQEKLTIPVIVEDNHGGASHIRDLVITVTGTNDAPVLDTITAKSAIEGGAEISGTITSTDVDDNDTAKYTTTSHVAGFHLNQDGTYTFDPTNTAYENLAKGDQLVLTIPVAVTDKHHGTDTQDLVITVTGTNDAPQLNAITQRTANEGGSKVTGTITVSDKDDHESHTYTTANTPDGFVLNTDGSYSFDPSVAAYQHIAQGHSETLTIPVIVTDQDGGTDSKNLVIVVNGTNDPANITGLSQGSTIEDSAAPVTGKLDVTDVDDGESSFNAKSYAGSHGSLTMQADGHWSYTLDNQDSVVQALPDQSQLTDTISVTSVDGTTHQIEITIVGQNDAASITGRAIRTVREDSSLNKSGELHTQGDLTISDKDTGEDHFIAQQHVQGKYGYLT